MKKNTKNTFFMRGITTGVAITLGIGGLIQLRFKNPEIVNYVVVYADKGQTITSICQEEYSSNLIDKIGMNTLRNNCLEETPDGVLKWGERVLVPVYKTKEGK